MTSPNFSAIRARLRYESLDDFMQGYTRFISRAGMFIPMSPSKLKPIGTTVRFQFLLQDNTTAMLGEGVVRKLQGIDPGDTAPVGMLVRFTRLDRDTKNIVNEILARKHAQSAEQPGEAQYAEEADPPEDEVVAASASTAAPAALSAQDTAEIDDPPTPTAGGLDAMGGESSGAHDDVDQDLDDLFLSPDDDFSPAPQSGTADADPFDISAGMSDELLADALGAGSSEADEHNSPDFNPDDFDFDSDMSGFEVDSSAHMRAAQEALLQDPAPADADQDQDSTPGARRAEGHKHLGSTEAGLQIMAFDEIPDDEAVDFSALDLGGDDGDVDQMFDNVFGGLFGDDDDADENEDEEFFEEAVADQMTADAQDDIDAAAEDTLFDDAELLEDDAELLEEEALDDEPALIGAAAHDGGELLSADLLAAEEPLEDDFIEEESLEDELLLDEISEDEPDGDGAFLESAELVEESSDADAFDENDDAFVLEAAVEADAGELPETLDEESGLEYGEQSDDPPLSAFAPPAARSPVGPPPSQAAAPSADLLSALDTLDSDSDPTPDPKSLTLGTGSNVAAITADDAPDDEDDQSLSALLARAQHEIDAKRESEKTEESSGDIFDDLLGDQEHLPSPPKLDPVFDLSDPEPARKKKGGFMSRLFGKD